jgi:hypothetical protein
MAQENPNGVWGNLQMTWNIPSIVMPQRYVIGYNEDMKYYIYFDIWYVGLNFFIAIF